MNENNKKTCNGYESVYTFLSGDDLKKHLEDCAECAKEHAKMQKISELIQEAKPYIKKQKRTKILKAACAMFLFVFMVASYPLFTFTTNTCNNVIAQNTLTAEEMGLPVDEYGFIMAD